MFFLIGILAWFSENESSHRLHCQASTAFSAPTEILSYVGIQNAPPSFEGLKHSWHRDPNLYSKTNKTSKTCICYICSSFFLSIDLTPMLRSRCCMILSKGTRCVRPLDRTDLSFSRRSGNAAITEMALTCDRMETLLTLQGKGCYFTSKADHDLLWVL